MKITTHKHLISACCLIILLGISNLNAATSGRRLNTKNARFSLNVRSEVTDDWLNTHSADRNHFTTGFEYVHAEIGLRVAARIVMNDVFKQELDKLKDSWKSKGPDVTGTLDLVLLDEWSRNLEYLAWSFSSSKEASAIIEEAHIEAQAYADRLRSKVIDGSSGYEFSRHFLKNVEKQVLTFLKNRRVLALEND